MWIWLVFWLVGVNAAAMLVVRDDKRRAVEHRFRTPERAFRWLALLGGGPGVLVGFQLFRHKTKHQALQASVLLLTLLCAALATLVFYLFE